MKITVEREQLRAALSACRMAIPGKTPRPILRNVLLEATASGGQMQATNQEQSVRAEFDCECKQSGCVLIPADRLQGVLTIADGEIAIREEGPQVIIKAGRGDLKLPTQPANEFPAVARFPEKEVNCLARFTIDAKVLSTLIQRAGFATDPDSTRFALAGVLLEISERLTLVSTDGRRMAVSEGAIDLQQFSGDGDHLQALVPGRTMLELGKLLHTGTCEVIVQHNEVLFRAGRVTLASRQVEGRYPQWRNVFPEIDADPVSFAAGPLSGLIAQAKLACSIEDPGVHFAFSPGKLALRAQSATIGTSECELPCAYQGKDSHIELDASYCLDFLNRLPTEAAVEFLFDGSENAVILSNDASKYVIMPMSRE